MAEATRSNLANVEVKLPDTSTISAPASPQVDGESGANNDGRPQPKRAIQLPQTIRDIYIQLLENNLQEYEFAQYGK